MEKATLGFGIYEIKIWQILKRFAGTFCQTQTLKLGGVMNDDAYIFRSKGLCKFINCGFKI